MENLLYRYNPWWEGAKPSGLIERPKYSRLLERLISVPDIILLIGLRRIGKTSLMKLLISHLMSPNQGISPSRICYVSLDDYLLSKHSLSAIIEEYRKIHKIRYSERVYLFLDEVAGIKDFDIQLKNFYDSGNAKIYASSSSAAVLRGRKPYLTGRTRFIEIETLDFCEYLIFKNIKISKTDAHLKDTYFEEYLASGGLPEYVLRGNIDYVRELVDDVIRKDIVSYYNIKKSQILKDFFLLLMERSGKQISINKIANILKIAPDTANRYMRMFADVYLIYLVNRWGKTNDTILAPKKAYAADLGIRVLFTGLRDKGSLFENYVFLQIKHLEPRYIYQDGLEIDFITQNGMLIESKYDSQMNPKQQVLFNSFKAKKKFLIEGIRSFENFAADNFTE